MNLDRSSVPFGPREPFIFHLVKPGSGWFTVKAREPDGSAVEDRNTSGRGTT
jgi:hypothetical protein